MISKHEIVHIGYIQRTHGTSGELQCRMLNTYWEDNDATFVILNVDEIFVPFRVTDWRTKGSEDVLLTLEEVKTEQQALRYVGAEAYMLRSDQQEDVASATEFGSIVGYTLCDTKHGSLGVITAVDTSTLNTLAQLDSGVLIPLHEDFVTEANSQTRVLSVRLPEGLIEQ